jgi:hypothetical protein
VPLTCVPSMFKAMRSAPLLLLLVLATGCVGNGVATGRAAGRSDYLTHDDLMATAGQSNLYDALHAQRPNWLIARSTNSFLNPGQIQVYMDDVRIGGVDQLRNISLQGIDHVQWYDPITASSRWGLNHEMGAIVVATRPPS